VAIRRIIALFVLNMQEAVFPCTTANFIKNARKDETEEYYVNHEK
jgi:hypothetical protein